MSTSVEPGGTRDDDELDVTVDGDVFGISLDRPDELTAIDEALHGELATVFQDAETADDRVVVLTGNGDATGLRGDDSGVL